MVINLKEHKVDFKGESVPIVKVKSGHSCIRFRNFNMREKDKFYAMITIGEKQMYDYKTLYRIHDNLGHPSQAVMERMFTIAEKDEKEALKKVYEKCATCLIHRRPKSRPKVDGSED